MVTHDQAAFSRLLKGAKLVINVVGPFGQLGEPMVKAALECGVHYLDTTGEQDWTLRIRDRYGEAFAQTPEKEIPAIHQALISCWARGTTSGKQILLHITSPYLMTGSLAAEAARRILNGELRATGFRPATRAFGHRELMASLAEDGLHCWSEQVR